MRRIIIISTALLAAFTGVARQLTVAEAVSRASNLPKKVKSIAAKSGPTAAFTASTDEKNLLYVVNNPEGGFIVVSADDCYYPVIGYSESGHFCTDSIPEAALALLNTTAQSISMAIDEGITVADTPSERRTEAIPNFLSLEWDQGYPYNYYTPLTGNNVRTYTGCVATAMAMGMKHNNYPERGTGSHSYTWSDRTLSVDFSETAYRWDEMRDYYYYTSELTYFEAVAKLMYHCGVSVDMVYGSSASGAVMTKVPGALQQYFGYDDSMRYLLRRTFSIDQWCQIIYDQLRQGRPVFYSGGEHFFLCTGYDPGDFFYINWGWGGSANMFFKLNALSAAGHNFNSNEEIIINFFPDDGIECPESRFNLVGKGMLSIYYKNDGQVYQRRSNNTQYIWTTGSNGQYGIYNYYWDSITVTLGALFENVETGEVVPVEGFVSSGATIQTIEREKNVRNYQIRDTAFPQEGTFRLYPAAKDEDGMWHKIPFDVASPQYIEVTCTPTTFVFNTPTDNLPKLTATVTNPGDQSVRQYFNIPIAYSNIGAAEYNGPVSLRYQRDRDGNMWMATNMNVSLDADAEMESDFSLKLDNVGRYTMEFVDMYSNVLGRISMTLRDPAQRATLCHSERPTVTLTMPPTLPTSRADEPMATLTVTAPVECTNGYFYGPIKAVVGSYDTFEDVATLSSDVHHSIYTDRPTTVNLTGKVPAVPGEYYLTLKYPNDSGVETNVGGYYEYGDDLYYTVPDPSLTSSATIESDPGAPAEYYNLQGIRVNCPLPDQIYILRQGSIVTKVRID